MKNIKKGKSSNNKTRQNEQKKDNLFDSDLLTSKEKKWLKNNNSKLKCKIIRQYLTEDNILKWKPIPKTSKKTLKKIISKTLLSSIPDNNEILKRFLVLENTIYKDIDDIYAPKEETITEHLTETNDELVKQIEQNLKEIQELQEMKNH
ncbi:hypothetical protein BCR32DRAFT_297486 [Anaeromyces robustus]|uniref:Uncharacterized protein n=1 Tax=Anaeromyces robustus TaxID=1754192 RepID=A0A1Y1W4V9_9FUNG|nr:hypothetical protein BCR32DRAFT_297486 [Anaeromyces robustus]|eukprot:ORX68438.1 hypothetical protein BCR32DRAFT_297486 [Anaeromyces robustus]